jgi:hypothetical protein
MGLYIWMVVATTVAAAILATIAVHAWQRRKGSEQLQLLFGPEYDRAVRLYGSRRRAELALESRRKRLEELNVHELSDLEREQFLLDWRAIRETAMTESAKLHRSNDLLTEILRAEGCLVEDADQRDVDVALVHPTIAQDYRAATEVQELHRLGLATSDECRSAMVRYTRIFESVLGDSEIRDRLKKVS